MRYHVVFDFDCTITSRHLFKTTRNINKYVDDWKKETGKDMVPEPFYEEKGFVDYIYGSEKRIFDLMNFLQVLKDFNCYLHIVTNSEVCDVENTLESAKLLPYFSSIYGMSGVEKYIKYFDPDMEKKSRPFTEDRSKFIYLDILDGALGSWGADNFVFYIDDDDKYYKKFKGKKSVICIDIGAREKYYQTGKPGLDLLKMFEVVSIVKKQMVLTDVRRNVIEYIMKNV